MPKVVVGQKNDIGQQFFSIASNEKSPIETFNNLVVKELTSTTLDTFIKTYSQHPLRNIIQIMINWMRFHRESKFEYNLYVDSGKPQ